MREMRMAIDLARALAALERAGLPVTNHYVPPRVSRKGRTRQPRTRSRKAVKS